MTVAGILFVGSLAVLVQHGGARVHTEAQAGPLYRVVGSTLSISCSTSGFADDSATKAFEVKVTKPDKPDSADNVISTDDEMFSYSRYLTRVKRHEISLNHTTPNSVVFVIQSLQKQDEGEYECLVVNSDVVYDGTYSAQTAVKVIDDSLSVSSPATSLSSHEGDELELTCHASSSTVQHTHLSLAWFLHRDHEEHVQLIISLDRDFTLRPGPGFESRYRAGLIKLDKKGEASYSLGMTRLELSDQGRIYCQAQEWIQEPDLSWYSIVQKDSDESRVHVTALEIDAAPLVLRLTAQQTALQEGQPLTLTCSVDSQNLEEKLVGVAWLRDDTVLAEIGPTGIQSVLAEYRSRERNGSLRASRVGLRDYQLVMTSVRTEDQGRYSCRAWLSHKDLTQGTLQDSESESDPLQVSVVAADSLFSVSLKSRQTTVPVGGSVELMCQVRGPQLALTVTWSLQRDVSTIDNILSLHSNGTISWSAEQHRYQLKVQNQVAGKIYYLLVNRASQRESGSYQCTVSFFLENVQRKPRLSNQLAVVVRNPETGLQLTSAQDVTADMNSDVELKCSLTSVTPSARHAVTWTLRQRSGNVAVMRWDRDSVISGPWAEVGRRRISMRRTEGPSFELTIRRAVSADAGSYTCEVVEWLQDPRGEWFTLSPVSTMITLTLTEPADDLRVNLTRQQVVAEEGQEVELTCVLVSASSGSSILYKVSWFYAGARSPRTSVLLVELDHTGLLRYSDHPELRSLQGRLRLSRPTPHTFGLRIQPVHGGDNGTFWCDVEQYQMDKDWQQRASASAGPIALSVNATALEIDAAPLVLRLTAQQTALQEGQPLTLTCSVDSQNLELGGVAWLRDDTVLAKIGPTGIQSVMAEYRSRERNGSLRASRVGLRDYQLVMTSVRTEDQGRYSCRAWLSHKDLTQGTLQDSDSDPLHVSVVAADSLFSVSLTSRQTTVPVGGSVELMCQVRGPQLALTVTWSLQRDVSTIDNILSLHSNGTISWSAEQHRYQLKVQNQVAGKIYYLLVNRASQRESGSYQCTVSFFLENVQRKLPSSNQLAVVVRNPETGLQLTSAQDVTADMNSDVELKCSLTSVTPSARHAVTWTLRQRSGNVTVMSWDRDSVISGPWAEVGSRRISMRRAEGPSFELTIRRAVSADAGSYTCEVVEWLQDPRGEWFTLSPVSTMITLNLTEPGAAEPVSGCNTSVWILSSIILVLVLVLVLVLTLLLLKMCRSAPAQKNEESLWAEQHALMLKD